MKRVPIVSGIVLIAFLSFACTMHSYSIVLYNSGSRPIDNAHVTFKNFQSIGGYLSPGARKFHEDIVKPLPDTVRVNWSDSSGVSRSQDVRVANVVSGGFRGDLYFVFRDDGTVILEARSRERR